MVEPVGGRAAEAEPARAGIKERGDASHRLSQGKAVPSRQARRDRDRGCRSLAAVLIREGELVVEQNGAVILQVAGSRIDAAADHRFLVDPHHAHRASDGRAPLGREPITIGLQHVPADRAAAAGRQAAGAAPVADRAQQRLVISQAGRTAEAEQARAVVIAAVDAGYGGVFELVTADPAAADADHRLGQLAVIGIRKAEGWGKGDGSTRLGINQRTGWSTAEHRRIP